ncbi:MAG: RraA family protein [Halobacteriota archaeon]
MTRTITDVFSQFDTSIVSDALDEHDIDGVVTGLHPAHPDSVAVGRARTLQFSPVAGDAEEATNFPYAMLTEIESDRMLVIDGVGDDLSCWGGNASRLAAAGGANGVVIDGGFRDVREVRSSSVPVFAARPTPRTGQRRVRVSAVDEPIDLRGVTVEPDDVLVADATGIVVVPSEAAEAVAQTAESILAEELLVESKIEHGATIEELQRDDHAF